MVRFTRDGSFTNASSLRLFEDEHPPFLHPATDLFKGRLNDGLKVQDAYSERFKFGKIISMVKNSPNLSVIVAAYNESAIITKNLGLIVAELNTRPEVSWELICVNDGSQDNTGELMENWKKQHSGMNTKMIHHRRNFGQGRALRNGFDICQGQIIITLDADLSYKTENIFKLYDTIITTMTDIVLASAYMDGGTVKNVPFHRFFLSRFANVYLARITGQHISTSTCVVRAYLREVIDSLILTSDGMDLQMEILVKATSMGFRVCEVPALLEWSEQKALSKKNGRNSKMRILNTIYNYSLLGWLHRPASAMLFLSWLLILPGLYMALTIIWVTVDLWKKNLIFGFAVSLQKTLRELVQIYSQNITFAGIFLGFGIIIFSFSLILLQNKSYFDELSRMIQRSKNS